jgi:membrane-associated PAP2 superfamily phosphatase
MPKANGLLGAKTMRQLPWDLKTVGAVSVATPLLVVSLVLVAGATVFLRSQRYIRRTTAYLIVAASVGAIAVLALLSYSSRM